ncbi:phosphonate ABC transporter, permease protein PhnE [Siccirubricoccus sp. KC 17139]|uniref:Phosphonate ABC transporter, permease protein PhnE n=1 Tax=Siccirubricoccus soli TaxID=2899147 RepID=A0ABT1D9P7_9PROT|nr:phosphonate ABC transporter, permease protein PhnE [Siccirubricoccus soli]MCO6418337.1 phosphonate ABC transporter, permease protein PhnE [Siccirubricoccus soli]MCP2684472.1 phosphonate ABC transporter, permease protein PhnE [Siccirubricoccus soli]
MSGAAASLPLLPAARLAPLVAAVAAERAAARRRFWLSAGVLLALALLAGWVAQVEPGTLLAHGDRFFSYFARLLTLETGDHTGQWVWRDPAEWLWGWKRWLALLGDTLLMAYVGTVLGATGGFLFGLLSAANITRSAVLRWGVKRVLEFCRTVPDVVFALVFVIAFGLGPLPGVLAIAIHTFGALGKQFSEIVENIDLKPVDGAMAAGAGWPAMARFAVVPQVLPGFLAYGLLRFEVNVRGAAVLGFVGAGGIGQDLVEAIRKFYYNDVAALLLFIILTVVLIDSGTSILRRRLMEERA